jgi:uncharacterized protein YukJ
MGTMRNAYCMFKGKLICGAPCSDVYIGGPHCIVTVGKDDETTFNIVVNSASRRPPRMATIGSTPTSTPISSTQSARS